MFKLFNFKLNIKIIKIFLFLTILTFFLPFFAVSCGPNDAGINFSGFALSTGKNINGKWYDGNLLGFIIIIPPVILLILSFFIYKTKSKITHIIIKTVFFIVPIFDIFVVFIVRAAFKAGLSKAIAGINPENSVFLRNLIDKINLTDVHIKSGFILYIIFNAIIFIFAVINYFTNITETEQ